jgi:beta-glucosidase
VASPTLANWQAGWQYEPGAFRIRVGTSVVDLPLETTVEVA